MKVRLITPFLSGSSQNSKIFLSQNHRSNSTEHIMSNQAEDYFRTSTARSDHESAKMKPIELTVKVLVVGAVGVGKTSILNRYLRNHFSTFWKATIGVDFGAKTVQYNDYTKIHLHFWDVGGQERFTSVTRVYYQNAGAIIIVFDVTRESTLVNDVLKWKEDISKKMEPEDFKNMPIILIGNKSDVVTNWSELNKERIETMIAENKFAGWGLTSAKANSGIENMVNLLIEKVLENKERLKPKYDPNAFKLKDEYYYVDEYYDNNEPSKCKCIIS